MTLYKVRYTYGSDYYYWAENEQEARELFIKQGAPDDTEIQIERVWANNEDPRFRGYIVQL